MRSPALLLCALFSACAAPVRLAYQPTGNAMRLSFPDGKPPRLYLGAVEDKSHGFRTEGPVPTLSAGNSTVDVLRDALKAEFTRLGIPLAPTRQGADAVLYAALSDALVSVPSAGFYNAFNASVSMSLLVRSLDWNSVLWMGEVKGTGMTKGATGGYSGSKPNLALNAAFADMISRIGPLLEAEGVADIIRSRAAPAAPAARQPAAPVAAAAASEIDDLGGISAAASRQGHAVVIGVQRYREKLPAADFAASDARLVARYLTGAAGFKPENVVTLVDDQAAKSDFEKYFERWLPNRVGASDEVFIYFSGHGAPDPTSGNAFLVPYDGDPTYLEQTGYSLSRMYAQLEKLPAKKVTVVLDSCFSGAGGRSVIAKGAKPLVVSASVEVPRKLTVLSASEGNQISHSYDAKGHGLFTFFLLKGLKDQALAGRWDLRQAFEASTSKVSAIARQEFNADQTPKLQGGW
jgi:hypothetical protein